MNLLAQRDPEGALGIAVSQYDQTNYKADVQNASHDGRAITKIIVTGMGGSALAALLAQVWLRQDISVPFEVTRSYQLPSYVDQSTLVIASSYSGNTEETISALEQARTAGAQLGVIASGGVLLSSASTHNIAHVQLPSGLQPRMGVIYNLTALTALLANFGLVSPDKQQELASLSEWLHVETMQWAAEVPLASNYAKQLALESVGKTPVIYGGDLTAPVAYKWKISWNENAKNTAFWNQFPEFNHNEFIGWSSHPVDKPFVVFDLVSRFEHPRVLERFALSDRLLSGMRPKAITINLPGDTVLAQLLWASILADFVSIYVAVLNNVDPTPVALVERLKKELG